MLSVKGYGTEMKGSGHRLEQSLLKEYALNQTEGSPTILR